MKNSRSLFVNWTRPRTLRCSTVNCCLSAAFPASSRLLDLKSEETRFKNRKISPTIVADVKRFSHQIKRTKFSAHTGSASTDLRIAILDAFNEAGIAMPPRRRMDWLREAVAEYLSGFSNETAPRTPPGRVF